MVNAVISLGEYRSITGRAEVQSGRNSLGAGTLETETTVSEISWHGMLFDGKDSKGNPWYERIRQVCEMRFRNLNDAEAAFNYTLDKLVENEWERCRKYGGRASPGTYLVAISRNLMEDWARTQHGRCRPPKFVAALGHFFVQAHRFLCCEKRPQREALEQLVTLGATRELASTALAYCNEKVSGCRSVGLADTKRIGQEWQEQYSDSYGPPDESEEAEHEEHIDQVLNSLLSTRDAGEASRLAGVVLDADVLFALREIYLSGRKLTEVAEMAGKDYFKLRRKLKEALKALQESLGEGG